MINGEKIRRSYSLCSSPIDNEFKIGIKQIPNGKFSTFACETLKVGDVLSVAKPEGKFHIPLKSDREGTLVAFAAGSGITPILSIIKTHLNKEANTKVKLFYTNKSVSTIMLKEEIEALKNEFFDRFELFYFLTKEKRNIDFFNGRMDDDKLDLIFKLHGAPNDFDHYFICGPEKMIFGIKDYLKNHGVAEEAIHFELFGTELPQGVLETIATQTSGAASNLTIIEGGKTMVFDVTQGKGNILDYALNNSADLPYACKGGVCCTCRAKLIEGKVKQLRTFGLEQDEIDNNYILTCQSIPLSDKIVVDFDQ
jgi:ring-1,2-phenylacetyl-CoA epoxidase subunit PaaE